MHLWIEIALRESFMLVTLAALGSGPAALLGRRVDGAVRLAMTPVLGLCLGTGVFTTLIWFTAARNTYWLLPLLAIGSLTIAIRRTSANSRQPGAWRIGPRDALALMVVCVVVGAPLNSTLHERDSVGPIGYFIVDSVGYVAETDAMTQQSIRQAGHPQPEKANLTRRFFTEYLAGYQNLDAAPLSANVNELIGLGSTDTQTLFLIVFLMGGALGVFAAVRYFAPKPGWVAPVGGVLFAGPLFLQLMADGSQAAICGISVIPPLAVVGSLVLREQRRANLVVLALLASGIMALYPLLAPGVVVAGAMVLPAAGILAWRRHTLSWRLVRSGLSQIVVLLGLTMAFNIVSLTRDLHYWAVTVNGDSFLHKPEYELPFAVLPGWLLQTRQFFFLTPLAHATPHELLIGVILPVIFILVILIGLWRRPLALILVPSILVCSLSAEYTSAKYNCSYCVDRNMLPVGPLCIALLAIGIAALATLRSRWLRWLSVPVALAALISVGAQTRTERQLFANNAYFLDGSTRKLVSDLPPHSGPLQIEAYGQDPHRSVGELAFTYIMTSERNHQEASLASEFTDFDALSYLNGPHPDNPQLDPGYRFVITRLGGVQTARRVLARAGPLALEERTEPLDVTVTSGIAMPAIRLDQRGLAPVIRPLHLLVVGNGTGPVWVLLRFDTIEPAKAPPQPGVRSQTRPHSLTVCVRASGTAPQRRAAVAVEAQQFPGLVPNEPFAVQEPPQGIELAAMRVVSHCPLHGTG